MSNPTAQQILEATNGGLDVILRYLPAAEPGTRNKSHKFALRDEKTPSCNLYLQNDGRWIVYDYGAHEGHDAFDIAARFEGYRLPDEFGKCVRTIAELFGIQADSGKVSGPTYKFSKRDATDGETEGQFIAEEMELTIADAKAVFSDNVWRYLGKKGKASKDRPDDETALKNAQELCSRYNLKSLSSYSIVKKNKTSGKLEVLTFGSTDLYPMLMWDEGDFQKIYKPKEREKKYRFMFSGKKPTGNYMWGYRQCNQYLDEHRLIIEKATGEDTDEKKQKSKEVPKLPEIIICTGGSDALNVAACGYSVVWFDSESADVESGEFRKLTGMAERVFNLPDLDATGKREGMALAEQYLDLHTIWLPEGLLQKRDLRGNACKDVRDYFRYWKPADFKNLLNVSYPLKFWDEELKVQRDGTPKKKHGRFLYEYRPNNELIYNFLTRMGYGMLEMPSEKNGEAMIFLDGGIVRRKEFRQVSRFVIDFLKARHYPTDLYNAFYNSDRFTEKSLSNLPYRTIDFNDTGREYQWMFFENQAWEVTATDVIPHELTSCGRYVWEKEVIQHHVKKQDSFFTIAEKDGSYGIEINPDHDCEFFRFLINTSRVHWRKELEERLDTYSAEDKAAYLEKFKWSVNGDLLSEEESLEQMQHLIAKICSFGYLLHRYKDPAEAFVVWAMDYMIAENEENASHGGTGKSMAYGSLEHLMTTVKLEGRNPKLTANPHVLENVTEHSDLLFIDDAYEYFDFNFFYSSVTSFMTVNPKGTKSYELSFDQSPKICIPSNFPPRNTDKSTRRRLWFTCFSDYYHKNPNNEYREERVPKDEFGRSFFKDWDGEEWNRYLNFMAQCIQAWLQFGQVEPPLDTVMKNTYRSQMGANFQGWADNYFSEENDRLNRFTPRYMAYQSYVNEVDKSIKPQSWLQKLQSWCRYNDMALNPTGETPKKNKDGRFTSWVEKMEYKGGSWQKSGKKEAVEMLYLRTTDDAEFQDGLADVDVPF